LQFKYETLITILINTVII